MPPETPCPVAGSMSSTSVLSLRMRKGRPALPPQQERRPTLCRSVRESGQSRSAPRESDSATVNVATARAVAS